MLMQSEVYPYIWNWYGGKYYNQPGEVLQPPIGWFSNIRPQFLDDKLSSLQTHLTTLLSGRTPRPKMTMDAHRPHVGMEDYPAHKALLQAQITALEALAKCGISARHPESEQALSFLVNFIVIRSSFYSHLVGAQCGHRNLISKGLSRSLQKGLGPLRASSHPPIFEVV